MADRFSRTAPLAQAIEQFDTEFNRAGELLQNPQQQTQAQPFGRFQQFPGENLVPRAQAQPEPEPEGGVWDFAKLAAEGLTAGAASDFATSVIGTVQGREGAATPDVFDTAVGFMNERRNNYNRRVAEKFSPESVLGRGLSALPSFGTTGAAMVTGAVAGTATTAATANPALGAAASFAAPAATLVRSTAYRDAIDKLDMENENRKAAGKQEMTTEEAKAFLDKHSKNITHFSLSEGIPEALSTVVDLALISRIPGGSFLKGAGKIAAGSLAAEVPSEALTEMLQSHSWEGTEFQHTDQPYDFQKPGDYVRAVKDVWVEALTISGGVGVAGAAVNKYRDVSQQAKRNRDYGVTPEQAEVRDKDGRLIISGKEVLRNRWLRLMQEKMEKPTFNLGGKEAIDYMRTGSWDGVVDVPSVPKDPAQTPAQKTQEQDSPAQPTAEERRAEKISRIEAKAPEERTKEERRYYKKWAPEAAPETQEVTPETQEVTPETQEATGPTEPTTPDTIESVEAQLQALREQVGEKNPTVAQGALFNELLTKKEALQAQEAPVQPAVQETVTPPVQEQAAPETVTPETQPAPQETAPITLATMPDQDIIAATPEQLAKDFTRKELNDKIQEVAVSQGLEGVTGGASRATAATKLRNLLASPVNQPAVQGGVAPEIVAPEIVAPETQPAPQETAAPEVQEQEEVAPAEKVQPIKRKTVVSQLKNPQGKKLTDGARDFASNNIPDNLSQDQLLPALQAASQQLAQEPGAFPKEAKQAVDELITKVEEGYRFRADEATTEAQDTQTQETATVEPAAPTPGSYDPTAPNVPTLEAHPLTQGANVRHATAPTAELQALADSITALTGTPVQFIAGDKALPYGGVFVDGTIYINAEEGRAFKFMMGHETFHSIEEALKTTEGGRKMLAVIDKQIQALMPESRRQLMRVSTGGRLMKKSEVLSEMRSDVFATFFDSPQFWNEVLAKSQPSKTTMRTLFDAVLNTFDRIMLAGTDYAKYRDEINGTRKMIAETLGNHLIGLTNDTTGELQAEVTDREAKFAAAYHGSPHQFDEFSLVHIGTGEGNQAFGWGMYFAGDRSVAEWYKDKLTRGKLVRADGTEVVYDMSEGSWNEARTTLIEKRGDFEAARADINKKKDRASFDYYREVMEDALSYLDDFQEGGVVFEGGVGALYQVELAPKETEYLLWDVPLSEQSEEVNKALAPLMPQEDNKIAVGPFKGFEVVERGGRKGVEAFGRFTPLSEEYLFEFMRPNKVSGRALYELLTSDHGSAKAASEHLRSLGIRGIKFLDGSSRREGEGNYNYVIFDDKDVSITAKFRMVEQQPNTQPTPEGFTADAVEIVTEGSREEGNLYTAAYWNDQKIGEVYFLLPNEHFFKDAEVFPQEWATVDVAQLEDGFRGHGVGTKLYDAAVAKAKELGYKGIASDPQLRNQNSNALWQKLSKGKLETGHDIRFRADVVNVDGVDRPTTNSEGRPIHAAEEGIRNFWRWFGDSKVTDDQGRPIVMYHGTDKSFDAFDKRFSGQKDSGFLGDGFYFTADTETADAYADYHADQMHYSGDYLEGADAGQNTMPVYLKIESPYMWDGEPISNRRDARRKQRELIEAGHDGVVLNLKGLLPGDKAIPFSEVVTFSPTQIKSATGNTGAFDGTNPDIRFRIVTNPEGRPESHPSLETAQTLLDHYQYLMNDNSKAAVTMMSPEQFLSLTPDGGRYLQERVAEYGQFDESVIDNADKLPTLYIEKGDPVLYGHEGRARMTMAQEAGFARIPVVLYFRGRQTAEADVPTSIIPETGQGEPQSLGSPVLLNRQKTAAQVVEQLTGVPAPEAQFRFDIPKFTPAPLAGVVEGAQRKGKRAYDELHRVAKELGTPQGRKDWGSEIMGQVIKAMPIRNLKDLYGAKHKVVATYEELVGLWQRQTQAPLEHIQPYINALNNKYRHMQPQFNKAAVENSFLQMTPWLPIHQQDWVPNDPSLKTVADKLSAAQEAWVFANMHKKTGMSFAQAYKAGKEAYDGIQGAGSGEVKAIYKTMSNQATALHKQKVQQLRQWINESTAPEDTETRARLERMLIPDNVRGAYWPLKRTGRYGLSIKRIGSTDPSQNSFSMYQSRSEQRAALEAAKRQYDPNEFEIKVTEQSEQEFLRSPIPMEYAKEMQANIEDRLRKLGIKESVIEDLTFQSVQLWMTMQPETSSIKNSIRRKTVRGTNYDYAINTMAQHVVQAAGTLASMKYGRQIEKALRDAHTKAQDTANEKGTVVDPLEAALLRDLNRRWDETQNATTNWFTRGATKMASLWYMSSPSAYMVQASQPLATGLPKLMADFGPGAVKHLSSAFATTLGDSDFTLAKLTAADLTTVTEDVRIVRSIHEQMQKLDHALNQEMLTDMKRIGLSQESVNGKINQLNSKQQDMLALLLAIDKGALNATMVNEVIDSAGMREGTGATMAVLYFMRKGEEHSRISQTLAGMRSARAAGYGFFKAADYAAQTTIDTMFDYSKAAKPALLQKGLFRVATQFQYFTFSVMARSFMLTMKSLGRGLEGVPAAERAQVMSKARKELTGMMSMSMLLGGMLGGVPTAATIAMIQFIVGIGNDDEPRELRGEFAAELEQLPGGMILTRGIMGAFGADVSRRIGMADVFGFGDPGMVATGGRQFDRFMAQMAGPWYSAGRDFYRGYDMIEREGKVMDGLIAMSPKGVKDVLKAVKFGGHGIVMSDGTTLKSLEELTESPEKQALFAWSLLLQASGVAPTQMNAAFGKERTARLLTQKIQLRRSELVREMVRALDSDDSSRVDKVIKEVIRFNERMPAAALSNSDFQSAATALWKKKLGVRTPQVLRIMHHYGLDD